MAANPQAQVTPLFVSTQSRYGIGMDYANIASGSNGAAVTWTANLAVYLPIAIPFPYAVNRVFWANGSTVASSNCDFGIYTFDGTRLYSVGSTAMSGTSVPQFVTPGTTFVLDAGRYYFGWSCDNTTSRGFAVGTAGNAPNYMRLCGALQESLGSVTLPATMTPVAYAQSFGAVLCGVTRTTTGF